MTDAGLVLVATDTGKELGSIRLAGGKATCEGLAEQVFRSRQHRARKPMSDADLYAWFAKGWSNGPLAMVKADAGDKTKVAAASDAPAEDKHHAASAAILAALLAEWPHLSTALVEALATAAEDAVATGGLAALGSLAAPAGVTQDLADAVTVVMLDAARAAADETVTDAAEQGVTVTAPAPDHDRLAQVAAATVGIIAAGYVAAAVREALQAPPDRVGAHVRLALAALSSAQTGLVASNLGPALLAAEHEGRRAVFEAHPPKALIADEHPHDSNQCDACREVDGRRYDTLAAALVDYPGYGGHRACAGGPRCRGELRAEWT